MCEHDAVEINRGHSKERTMETRVDEIADHIYRLSTFVPDVGPHAASRSTSS